MSLSLLNRVCRATAAEQKNIHRRKDVKVGSTPVKAVNKILYKMCGRVGGLP